MEGNFVFLNALAERNLNLREAARPGLILVKTFRSLSNILD